MKTACPGAFVFGLLALLASSLASAGEPAPGEAEAAAWIADLADPGPKAAEAAKKLRDAGPEAVLPLEKAAGEAEPDLARKWRARAIIAFRKAEGSDAVRELHGLLAMGAWDLPKEAPAFLAAERDEAKRRLEAAGPEVIPVLFSTYPGEDYARYALARDLLVKRGKEAFPGAVELLAHKAFVARLRAVHVLALIGGDEALELLSKASADPNVEVRRRVLTAWGEAKGKWASRAAEYVADAEPSIRVAAIRALEGRPEGAAAVAARLADDFFIARKAAGEVLASAGDAGFEALLRACGQPGAAPARLEALRALGLAVRPDPKEAAEAAEARRVRAFAAAVDAMIAAWKDPDWAVRAAAAEGLGLAGATRGLPGLLATETHPFARFRMEEALGNAGRGFPPDPARFDAPPGPLTVVGLDAIVWLPGDEDAIDDALKALKLARKDLLYDRNFSRDEFRFPALQKGLDDPLALPAIARGAMDRLRAARTPSACSLLGALPAAAQAARPYEPWDREPPRSFWGVRDSLDQSGLPPAVVAALRAFLSAPWPAALESALHQLNAADRRRILSHVSELGWDPELLPAWKKVNAAALAWAADLFARSAYELGVALSDVKLPPAEGVLWRYETPFGRLLVSGTGPDRHQGPHFLILDLGGDDLYLDGAAAGALGSELAFAASAVVDLSGNDRYEASKPVAQGAGFLGIGVLVDLAGNDTYRATAHAQGCGWFGCGILADFAGDDRYDADQVAQGAAGFGFAALADEVGDDVYYARAYAQGFGFTGGVGLLADARGNDLYYVDGKYLQYETMPHRKLSMGQGMGFGMRPHAGGGVGILWEGGGDDVYRGNAFAQGSSYWFALGMLVDEGGFDNYSATIYSQASGIHMGVGFLADLDGDDNYTSWGLSQSGSHDLGVSVLLEAQGNDMYTCHDASLGGAINHAVSIFLDRSGRDAYFVKNRMAAGSGDLQGQKDWQSVGIFLDLGGSEDTYPVMKGGNGRMWAEGNCGIGIDR